MSDALIEYLLFEGFKLDKEILNIKREKKKLYNKEKIDNKYSKEIYNKMNNEIDEWFIFTKEDCYERTFLFHPDTEASFIEIVTKVSSLSNGYKKKKWYIYKDKSIHKDNFNTNIIDEIKKDKLYRIDKTIIKPLLLYLTKKYIIYEYDFITESC